MKGTETCRTYSSRFSSAAVDEVSFFLGIIPEERLGRSTLARRLAWMRVELLAAPGLAACCCSSRPIIGMDEHWTTLTRAAPVGGARLAIRRASFAISDCWQSPQLRGGLDHTPVSRRCSNISQNGPCTEHTRLCCCSSRLSRERGATVACQKSGIYPRFDSAAGLGQIPLIPGQIPYLILRVTGLDSASGPIPGNGKHWLQA